MCAVALFSIQRQVHNFISFFFLLFTEKLTLISTFRMSERRKIISRGRGKGPFNPDLPVVRQYRPLGEVQNFPLGNKRTLFEEYLQPPGEKRPYYSTPVNEDEGFMAPSREY